MGDSEKMEALKKAYAEIILNTAKESAARILAAERKALGFQQSLFAAKEEAVATLLRVKAVMDSKVREAGIQSLGHVRRIQELEVQLLRAEDTISSLRMELNIANTKLEQRRKNLAEELIEEQTATSDKEYQENNISADSRPCFSFGPEYASAPEVTSPTVNQRVADNQCCFTEQSKEIGSVKDIPLENACTNPDLASIIMRSKEAELYRNGCTQRIRAFEQNLLTAKLPPGQSDDQFTDLKSQLLDGKNETDQEPCAADSTAEEEIQTKRPIKTKDMEQESNDCGDGQVKFFRRVSPRKLRTRSNHGKNSKFATCHDKGQSDQKASGTNFSKITIGENIAESGETLLRAINEKILPDCSITSGSSENCRDMPSKKNSAAIMQCSRGRVTRLSLAKKNQMDTDDKAIRNVESIIDSVENGDDLLPMEDSEQKSPNSLAEEDVSIHKVDSDKADVPLNDSEIKEENTIESSGTSGQAETVRFLKYTFRRKRKRESPENNIGNTVPDKKSNSKRSADKPNSQVKSQKASLTTDSPRSNRRLVQVARQLISLSAKRW
ncbi:uncharacterized protein [Typha angustifolia]|uniref:uncharacterized protein n=1 Tax=Typha angustifolia TaxID=59011 RepID=UPI003C2E8699